MSAISLQVLQNVYISLPCIMTARTAGVDKMNVTVNLRIVLCRLCRHGGIWLAVQWTTGPEPLERPEKTKTIVEDDAGVAPAVYAGAFQTTGAPGMRLSNQLIVGFCHHSALRTTVWHWTL